MISYKIQNQLLTQEALSHLLISEWHLPFQLEKIKHQTLEALSISTADVNWLLHMLEWHYGLDIEEEVPLQFTLQEFMQLIIGQSKKQDTLFRRNEEALLGNKLTR